VRLVSTVSRLHAYDALRKAYRAACWRFVKGPRSQRSYEEKINDEQYIIKLKLEHCPSKVDCMVRDRIFSPHIFGVDGGSGLRVRRMGSVGNILHCDAQIGGGPNWAKNAKKSGI
jgi:hypothetical protein